MKKIVDWFRWRFSVLGIATAFFSGRESQYYEYLHHILIGTQGKKSLRDIFYDDGVRYGRLSRGILSRHWAQVFEESGGRLIDTFDKTLPSDDVILIAAAQDAGSGALEQTFKDLAESRKAINDASRIFLSTVFIGIFSLAVMVGIIAMIPLYSFDKMVSSYYGVTEADWGMQTFKMYSFSIFLKENWITIIAFFVFCLYLFSWSMENWSGELRRKFDNFFLWKIYRDFQTIRFFSILSTLTKQRGNVGKQLQESIMLQVPGASPWLAYHLNEMLLKIQNGDVSHSTFDTGIVNRENYFYLSDMIINHGIDKGIHFTKNRIQTFVLGDVEKKAVRLKFFAILLSLCVIGFFIFWHYSVMSELKDAMIAINTA